MESITAKLNDFLNDVFESVENIFHLSDKEKVYLEKSNVARFIAALPFVAKCEDAKGKALSHLSIYLAEVRSDGYLGEENGDSIATVYEDLGILSSFDGGNPAVIQHGMSILALIMLEGYKDSSFTDMEQGIYNPLNDDSWDYYTLKANLLKDIKESPNLELDGIILSNTGLIKNHY